MDCNSCKEHGTPQPVPYIAHESAMARNERTIKRLLVALIISILLMFASNAIWLYVWNSYDYVSEDSEVAYQQDGEGVNIIGNRNGVDFDGAVGYDTETEAYPN